MQLLRRPGLAIWLCTSLGLGAVIAVTSLGPLSTSVWESAAGLFWLVVVAAALSVVASAAVVAVGHRSSTHADTRHVTRASSR